MPVKKRVLDQMNITVNGVDLYYEKSGSGPAIILLHGNGESGKVFDKLVPQLETDFTVYNVDSRCQGRSGEASEISYELMAEDMAAFITALNIEKPIFYGFSDGGNVGLILAARHPGMLSKLIVSGANVLEIGVKRGIQGFFRLINRFKHDKVMEIMFHDPEISLQDLEKIDCPTLVLAGSKDMIEEWHTRDIAEHIPGSTLNIIPGEGHMSYIVHSPKLYGLIKDFIK